MPTASTPTDYIASLPDDRRTAVQTLHKAIRKVAPALKPGMITFKKLEDLNPDFALELVQKAEKIGGAGAVM